jgi:hypothetical protein
MSYLTGSVRFVCYVDYVKFLAGKGVTVTMKGDSDDRDGDNDDDRDGDNDDDRDDDHDDGDADDDDVQSGTPVQPHTRGDVAPQTPTDMSRQKQSSTNNSDRHQPHMRASADTEHGKDTA